MTTEDNDPQTQGGEGQGVAQATTKDDGDVAIDGNGNGNGNGAMGEEEGFVTEEEEILFDEMEIVEDDDDEFIEEEIVEDEEVGKGTVQEEVPLPVPVPLKDDDDYDDDDNRKTFLPTSIAEDLEVPSGGVQEQPQQTNDRNSTSTNTNTNAATMSPRPPPQPPADSNVERASTPRPVATSAANPATATATATATSRAVGNQSQNGSNNNPRTPKRRTVPKKTIDREYDFLGKKTVQLLLLICISIIAVSITVGLIFGKRSDGNDNGNVDQPTAAPVSLSIEDGPTNSPIENNPSPTTGNEGTKAPTMATIPYTLTVDDEIALLELFESLVGDNVYVADTSEYSASQWIIYDDPKLLSLTVPSTSSPATSTSNNVIGGLTYAEWEQRFLLVFFYFSTTNNGQTEWNSCGPILPIGSANGDDDDECIFLQPRNLLLNDIDDLTYTSIPWTRWLASSSSTSTFHHECDWAGISCQTIPNNDASNIDVTNPTRRAVTGIEMAAQNLKGELITELLYLPKLQTLSLPYNELTGSIIASFGNGGTTSTSSSSTTAREYQATLTDLQLQNNLLSGTIPNDLFTYSKTIFQRLNLGNNVNISGTLPISISFITSLRELYLYNMSLIGSLPVELGQVPLRTLRLNDNSLTSTIPFSTNNIFWLDSMEEFWLSNNLLTGTIPDITGQFVRLQDIRLSSNQLIGTIPTSIYGKQTSNNLFRLDVHDNQLTGTISSSIQYATKLETFDVRRNQLDGTIPSLAFRTISNTLQEVKLQFNKFNGRIDIGSSSISNGEGNDNDNEDESTTIVCSIPILEGDCLSAFSPPNPCPCCTGCCSRLTLACDGTAIDDAYMP